MDMCTVQIHKNGYLVEKLWISIEEKDVLEQMGMNSKERQESIN